MKSGDVLRELNGSKITSSSSLQVAVSQITPGTTISLGILREGKPQTISVKVGEFHNKTEVASASDPSAGKGKIGVSVNDLTPEVRQQLNIPEQVKGAAVASVRPASPAEDAGLAPGDVILEVNRQPVASAEKFSDAVHAIPAGKDILLLVWSRGGASYRVVHPEAGDQNGE